MVDVFSNNHLEDIDRAWEGFVREKHLDRQIIRPVIASSWERSNNNRINPFEKLYCEALKGEDLQVMLERNRNVIRVIVPFMRMLVETCGEDLNATLSDADGYVLEQVGKPEVLNVLKQFGVIKGANISEKAVGTNTAGIVLVEKQPLQVLDHEHYCSAFHGMSCSAAPIFDPSGNLIAVLSISGIHPKINSNTLCMVIAAAKAIEGQLQLEKVRDELNQAGYFIKTVMESISEGLITVNHKEEITWINSAAGRILGLEPVKKIGLPLYELGNSLLPMQKVLLNGKFSNQVIIVENSRGPISFSMSTQPIKSENGEIIGAVSTLRELQIVHSVATNISGVKTRFTFGDLTGENVAFQASVSLARKASASSSTVLLQGESGTGKELFAQAIHSASHRARGPFIAVNCGTIPRDLIESELFGYDEGAFTGARRGGSPGKFELASGGTIFLDEIGDMPYVLQVSLLRCLQEKQVTRLGGRKIIPVDVRVIAATNRNLREEVSKGNFREDLYYRLDIITIKIPPLRERQSDIPMLADYFTRKIGPNLGKELIEISQEVMYTLCNYTWPGNVRELENALERAINVAPGNQILPEHLPETVADANKTRLNSSSGFLSLQEMERITIINTIQELKGNIAQAARVLGISRKTIYNKLKEYNIEVKFQYSQPG